MCFETGYDAEAHDTPSGALAALRRHAADGRRVAVVFSDAGGALLAEVHDFHPQARRVLIVGRGDLIDRPRSAA